MPQALVLGNGNMQINIGSNLQVNDLFYPYVGQENHCEFQKPHRIGVWVDGVFSWLSDAGWQFEITYEKDSFVGSSSAFHSELNIRLEFCDFVYTTHDVFVRQIKVHNVAAYERDIRVFLAYDFYIYGDKMQDTAQYEPDLNAVLHYRKKRYFLVHGRWENSSEGMAEYSVGKANYGDREGTWKDAEDGHLHGNAIEQGSVDSVVGFYKKIGGNSFETLNHWLIAGKNYDDILEKNKRVDDFGISKIYDHTAGYWREWMKKNDIVLSGLSSEINDLWYRSLPIIRSQIDDRGAIIASTDSDIMLFNRDSYAYMWPRDGALISMALSKTGYFQTVQQFLTFCHHILTKDGYAFNKYTPDKSLGSCWHPKIRNGKTQLPIQEDESALILVALWEFYEHSKMIEFVQEKFNCMVLKIGEFLMNYVDPKTGLPLDSYDPWEERHGVFTYTASTVYGGLVAAANLSRVTGHYNAEKTFSAAAKKMQKAILKNLYCEKRKRFLKGICDDGCVVDVVDANLAFVWEMGVLPADDERVINTMKAIESDLTVPNYGGIARYTNDVYHKDYNHDDPIPGNPWIITTLWLANWYIDIAKNRKHLQKAQPFLDWSARQANAAGILPEQVNPFTGAPLSVGPLTWSHSTFVDTVLRYSEKYKALGK